MKAQSLFSIAIFALVGAGVLGFVAVNRTGEIRACPTPTEGKVVVRAAGRSWDADSNGFAFLQGLSDEEGSQKAGRLNSRVHVDGQPDQFAITETGPEFEIEFETDQTTFRLVVEGVGFPKTISQPFMVPNEGCDVNIGKLNAPRGEGPEHTWPLPIVALEMGYQSWTELMEDNNAVVRILALGSGEEGVPDLAENSLIEAKGTRGEVYPFDMDTKISFLQMEGDRIGAFILVIPFTLDEPPDKEFTMQIMDTVTEADWNPPRPWKYNPVTVFVRNGFASDIRVAPSVDQ